MDAYANQTIKGYELRERVGAGTTGLVYRAYQPSVGREVAIKIIQPRLANQPDFIRRFEVEAHLVARLEHPHIVPLFDYWRDPEGAYLVMRWLPSNLRVAVERGMWSSSMAARLLDQIAAALSIAHRDNVIHCDIKPDNILLDEDENAYLADFSIAKDLSLHSSRDRSDAHAYVSPEQIRNEPLTPRTDIYSLGFVIYELLTGEKAFPDATTPDEYIDRHLNASLPPVSQRNPQVPAAIDEVLQTATAKEPSRRYANAVRFAAAFRAALPATTLRMPAQPLIDPLTERELDVLQCMITGLTNPQIAEQLFLSPATVKWYIKQIYSKLDVHSRPEAIERAKRLQLHRKPVPSASSGEPVTEMTGLIRRTMETPVQELVNPYKGLRAFQEADASDFFGRAAFVEQLLNRLSDGGNSGRFLVVTGPSGSGKSSVIKAGLIPALRKEALLDLPRSFIAEMLPGTHPLEELEASLLRTSVNAIPGLLDQLRADRRGLVRAAKRILPADPETELFLIIDQFEELFTLVADEAERKQFIDLLLSAAFDPRGRVRVVLTLRADFYDRPLLYPRLAELVRAHTEVIVPLTARELEQAIVAPAERVGVRLEEGLLATIIHDVSEQPGTLPLLQYALTEVFERREGLTLTLDAYRALGGVMGALTRRADDLYTQFDVARRDAARQVFLRLVTLGEAAEDTRRRVNLAELTTLYDESVVEDVINAFVQYRLLTLDHDPRAHTPTLEIAHEALIREWGKLWVWLAESRDAIRFQRSLAHSAAEWNAAGDNSFLLSGARLAQVEAWAAATDLALTVEERAFLEASLDERARLAMQEAKRIAKERRLEERSRRFLRMLVGVFAIASVIATGLSVLAFNLNSQATRSAEQFRSTALANGAQQALTDGKPDVALALAQEAVNMDDPPLQSQLTFFEAATSTWIRQRYIGGHTSSMRDAVFLPDGKRMVTVGWDGRAVLWDVATGAQLKSIQNDGRIISVAAHPDGHLVALSADHGRLIMWNVDTDSVNYLETDQSALYATLFTRAGTLLVGAGLEGKVFVWDLATQVLLLSFQASAMAVVGLDISPDEMLLLTASQDGTARIWDLATGEWIQTLQHPETEHTYGTVPWVWKALFLPDGERVLSGDTGGVVRLWDRRSGEVIWTALSPNNADVQDVALSPDGTRFATGANDPVNHVHLWDTTTGKLIRIYEGHTQRVQNVEFSPDGTQILSASNDGTAILWNVMWDGVLSTLDVVGSYPLAVNPMAPMLAIADDPTDTRGSLIRLVDSENGEVLHTLEGHRNYVQSLAFSPDGRLLISGDFAPNVAQDDQNAYVWDVATGEQLAMLAGHSGWLQGIAFSPDGRTAAIGEAAGRRIMLWDMEAFTLTRTLEGHQEWVNSLTYSLDGRYLYSGSRDGMVFKWDAASGEVILRIAAHPNAIGTVDISPDGTRLVTASQDGTARVWDAATGALLLTLRGHTESVGGAEFSPDGRTILTTSHDDTVILWDAATGERLRRIVPGQVSPDVLGYTALFSTDGQSIITAVDNQLIFWDAAPLPGGFANWVQENRYVAAFTCEQRSLYQIEPLCSEKTT